tara:strand:+ start:704 stop:1348 length:645 start_codon:yes stop_codon:yes gene_type:complete
MNANDLAGALAESKVKETTGLAGFSFMRMDFETGEWSIGQDGDIITNEEILVNTTTIQHGWILWSGGRPEKLMAGFGEDLPIPMPNIGDDYPSEGRSFQAAIVDDGEMIAFDTNSYGGRKGVDVLLGKIKAHAAEGSQHLYPMVKLTSESYANKKRGGKLTYNPTFEIVAWCDEAGVEEGKKAAQVEDQSEEVAEEETVEEAPTRQRRKRKSAA